MPSCLCVFAEQNDTVRNGKQSATTNKCYKIVAYLETKNKNIEQIENCTTAVNSHIS
jgi:hypothetical protein